MSSKSKSRPKSSVRRSIHSNACKRVRTAALPIDEGLDLTAINDSRDPALKAHFHQAIESELARLASMPSLSRAAFGQLLERASLSTAHKFSHLLPVEQQAMLAGMPQASHSSLSPTAA